MSRHSHDFRSGSDRHRQVMRDLDAYIWPRRPMVNLRALGWCATTLVICAFLMGMLVVGKG